MGGGAQSRDFLPESLLFSILQSRLFSGVFFGVLGLFFFCASRENHRILSEGSLGIPKGWSWEWTGSGSALGFGRIRDGIWDPGWNLGWKNPGWNPGWNLEFGMEESRLESGLQAGIWAGIPGMWSRSNTPESPKSLGIETIPSRPSGTIQRLRIPGKLGKSQERTSLTPKFHLLFQEEPIPAEIPEFGAVSPPPAEKSAGIFPGDPKKFPAPTLVGLPPPLFPANPDPSSEFRAGNGQNSAGAGSRTSGRAGHGSRSEFPEFGTGIESRTLALPPNLFPVFFLLVVFFNGSNFGIPGMPSGGGGGGGGRKSGIPGNFGVGFSSWKTPG
ncbi:uncharacterized protein LOC125317948 isoform X7 [Corvus hawaiiensis]|uniref:uncharacterized protein LOC125317948 isoform X7 n=1 Tax=Corvus hawaiiensis TaxID=134902 RepID=UPI002019E1AE|nr:uncharacterized protein LOC125317948 isoform X7 [Corvus hawaiiensis]